jgi:hypothetical protein
MIVENQIEEMISCFDDLFEIKDQTKDIVHGAREQVKAVKIALKDWCDHNELEYKDVLLVYKEYEKFKNGTVRWGEDSQDDFTSILVLVMQRVLDASKES